MSEPTPIRDTIKEPAPKAKRSALSELQHSPPVVFNGIRDFSIPLFAVHGRINSDNLVSEDSVRFEQTRRTVIGHLYIANLLLFLSNLSSIALCLISILLLYSLKELSTLTYKSEHETLFMLMFSIPLISYVSTSMYALGSLLHNSQKFDVQGSSSKIGRVIDILGIENHRAIRSLACIVVCVGTSLIFQVVLLGVLLGKEPGLLESCARQRCCPLSDGSHEYEEPVINLSAAEVQVRDAEADGEICPEPCIHHMRVIAGNFLLLPAFVIMMQTSCLMVCGVIYKLRRKLIISPI